MTTRPTDTVARLAGDEFVIVCRSLTDVLDAIAVAERVLAAIAPRVAVQTPDRELRHVSVGASIGVTHITDPATSAEALVRDADIAMYRAKELGRGRIEVFDQALQADADQRQQLREELGQAITGGEIDVYYQPIVELQGGRVKGFEALARWDHPERGLLAPAAFMATAAFGFTVVAEGVERPLHRSWLIDLGCELAQGYLFARPGPPGEIAASAAAETTRCYSLPSAADRQAAIDALELEE